MTRARLFPVLCLLALVGCSGAKPTSTGSPSPSLSASISRGSSAQPSASALPASSGAPTTAPSTSAPKPEPVRSAAPSVPPAAGTYTYEQSGGTTAGSFSIPVDETGTLQIGRASSVDGGARQRHVRRYSDDESGETTLLFTDDGIYIESTKATVYGFSQECQTEDPLLGVRLPLRVGATWRDSGTCEGMDLTLEGKVLRTERYRVGGRSILTYVVRVTGEGSGSQGSQTTTATMWLSPDYRLSVHGVSDAKGTSQGMSFTRKITETLTSLTPA